MGACVNTKEVYFCYFHFIQPLSNQAGPLRFRLICNRSILARDIEVQRWALYLLSFLWSKHDFCQSGERKLMKTATLRPKHSSTPASNSSAAALAHSLFLLRKPIKHLSSSAWRDNTHTHKKTHTHTHTQEGKLGGVTRRRGERGREQRERQLNTEGGGSWTHTHICTHILYINPGLCTVHSKLAERRKHEN